MRYQQRRARSWLAPVLIPLLGGLGSCGGSSTSHPPETSSGGVSVGGVSVGGVSTSAGAANHAGALGDDGGHTAMGGAGNGDAGANAARGGQDVDPVGGAGGDGCVDVCTLYGQACCVDGASCVSEEASCVIEVFDYLAQTNLDYPALEQLVASLPRAFRASLSTADVTSSAMDPSPSGRIELHLSAQASSTLGAALDGADRYPFRVSCAGQSLFVGQVYKQGGAAAIQTPVLHVSRDAQDAIVVRIGARQGAWAAASGTEDVAGRARIDRAELRSTLCLGGALHPL